MNAITIRASGVLSFDNCPQAYQFQYILGIQPAAPSANLAFGTAVHEACFGWLRAQLEGRAFDPAAAFQPDVPATAPPVRMSVAVVA